MTKTRLLITSILLAAGLAANAFGGYYYEATTTMTGDGVGNETTKVRVWVEGDKTRIEFVDGNAMGFGSDESYMISTDAGETMLIVDPEEEAYAELNMGELMGMAGKVMDAMGGMFKMEFTDFHSEKLGESDGEELLGYDTKQMRFQSGYTMSMSMMGRKTSNVVEMDQLMWVTDAIDARAINAWLRPDKRLSGMFEGLDEMMEQSFSQVQGVPLRSEIKTTTTDDKGKTQVTDQVTEVTALREEAVPAERFEIPEGYTRRAMESGDDESKSEEDDNPMKMLKDMFGGRGG